MAYELIKVSELPELTTPSDPNVLPIQDGDYLKRISFENLKDAAVGDMEGSLAAAYDSTAAYAVGDYCIYEGQLYRCTTAITTAEAWTAGHWTAAVLTDDIASGLSAEASTRSTNDNALAADIAKALGDLAAVYSTSATYAVGDYCIYQGQLYRCTTAITTAEAWTSGHWSAVALGDDTRDLRSALSDSMADAVGNKIIEFTPNKYINTSGSTVDVTALIDSSTGYHCAVIDVSEGDVFTITCTGGGSPRAWCWIDSNANVISRSENNITVTDLVLIAPQDASKLVLNGKDTDKISYYGRYLKDEVNDVLETGLVSRMNGSNVTVTENRYINYSTGNTGTVTTVYGATQKIPVVGGTQYKLILPHKSSTDSSGLAFYHNGGYISGVQFIKNTLEYIFTTPNNANEIAFTVELADANNNYFELKAVGNLYKLTDFVKKAVSADVIEFVQNVFAFNTVGIVGDSLASGCSNYKDDQDVWHAIDRKAFAWGKYLEKRQGCSVSLFTGGGMNTRTWFTSSNGYVKAQNDPCECYYVGLGLNDYSSLGSAYLGSSADVHVGEENLNADTFYGNYSKIIAALTTIQPRCKIFCFTMAGDQSTSSTRLAFDTAIRDVVAFYNNAYLLDLSDDVFFTSQPLSDTFYGAHYLATGYSMIADHILEITNKYMLNHLSDFMDIQWITNNHPNPDTSN